LQTIRSVAENKETEGRKNHYSFHNQTIH